MRQLREILDDRRANPLTPLRFPYGQIADLGAARPVGTLPVTDHALGLKRDHAEAVTLRGDPFGPRDQPRHFRARPVWPAMAQQIIDVVHADRAQEDQWVRRV